MPDPAADLAPDPAPDAGAPTDHPDGPGAALAAARAEAVGRLAALTGGLADLVAASRDSNADDEHDPEGATIAWERSQLGSFATRTRGQLAEIDAALARLAEGRYGRCEVCGAAIAPDRLVALPAARTCIACARARGVRPAG